MANIPLVTRSETSLLAQAALVREQAVAVVGCWLLVELESASLYISMAKQIDNHERRARLLTKAKNALQEVDRDRDRLKLRLDPAQVNQISAEAERLRFELDALL